MFSAVKLEARPSLTRLAMCLLARPRLTPASTLAPPRPRFDSFDCNWLICPSPSLLMGACQEALAAGASMAMLLRLLGALQLLCRASGSGTAVNCSRSIDVKHCSCADNAEAPACAEFGDFCERDAACPLEKRCQWDSRKVPAGSFVGGCVDDVPCRSRFTSQECVCLHHPGSDSACLWSAEHGVCAARQE